MTWISASPRLISSMRATTRVRAPFVLRTFPPRSGGNPARHRPRAYPCVLVSVSWAPRPLSLCERGQCPPPPPRATMRDRPYAFVSRRADISAPTRWFVRGCCRAFRVEGPAAKVFGPVKTGPRLEPRSQRRDLGSFPLHRLFGLPRRSTPERGQMLRRACCKPLASVFQHGTRRQTAGMVGGSAMVVAVRIAPPSLDQPFGLHARCGLPPAADRSRRLSAPRVGLPALGTASPRPLCPSDISPAQRGKPEVRKRGRYAGWLVRRRRAPAARSGNSASHASARPSRPCTGMPFR